MPGIPGPPLSPHAWAGINNPPVYFQYAHASPGSPPLAPQRSLTPVRSLSLIFGWLYTGNQYEGSALYPLAFYWWLDLYAWNTIPDPRVDPAGRCQHPGKHDGSGHAWQLLPIAAIGGCQDNRPGHGAPDY